MLAGWTCKIKFREVGTTEWTQAEARRYTMNGPFVVGSQGDVEMDGWHTVNNSIHDFEVNKVATRSVHRASLRVWFGSRGRYEVVVIGADPGETLSANVRNVPTLTNIVEMRYDVRAYENRALLALEIPAQAQLSGGVPKVTCLVKGKKVYDPRTGETAWSRNPVLCLRDLLLSDRYGSARSSPPRTWTTGSGAAGVRQPTRVTTSSPGGGSATATSATSSTWSWT